MRALKRTCSMALAVFVAAWAAWAQTVDPYRLIHDAALGLPILASPQRLDVRMAASTDPRHQNKDYLVLAPRETRTVATLPGPALLIRVWCTSSVPEQTTVRLQVDGKITSLLNDGKPAGYPPVKMLGGVHEKAFFSYYPIPVRQTCQLTVENRSDQESKFFYQMTYHPMTASVTWVTADPSRWKMLGGNLDTLSENPAGIIMTGTPSPLLSDSRAMPVCQAQRETDLLRLQGPGVIHFCRLSPALTDRQTLDKLFLLVRWDDERQPSVVAPLSWMFGQYFERGQIKSAFLSSNDKTFMTRFPMPFERTARFSIWNGSSTAVKVHIETKHSVPSDAVPPYRFCATAATQTTERGKPFLLLDAQGEGSLIGCTVGLRANEMSRTFSFLEGNERIEVDDDPQKALEGTGAEDFFNSAWFFPEQPFYFPFHGVTFKALNPPRVSAYRLLLTDRVPFRKRLRLTLQHGGRNSNPGCLYRAVTFWYQKAPRAFSPRPSFVAASQQAPASGQVRRGRVWIWVVTVFLALAAYFFYRSVDKRKRIS